MTEEMNEKEEVKEETTDGQPPKEQLEKPVAEILFQK